MISKDKEYRTAGGRAVQIYATGCGGKYPVHGAVAMEGGEEWTTCAWTADGSDWDQGWLISLRLIEVRPRIKRTVWLVASPNGGVYAETTKAEAQERARRWINADCCAIQCVEIDCEEGEGL